MADFRRVRMMTVRTRHDVQPVDDSRDQRGESSSFDHTTRTGGEIVADALIAEGVPYVVGIPGHGNLAFVDALRRRASVLPVITPRHEQSAVHIADGFYRASGQPLACFTSIGPGAVNTAVGTATAYVDSIPLLVITGATHVHMRGTGVLQELDRQAWSSFPEVLAPTCKRVFRIDRARQLPRALSSAFRTMLSGRPGPVLIDLPMDVQAESVSVQVPAKHGWQGGRQEASIEAIRQAADLLLGASRPVVLLGGGVALSGATAEATAVVEHLGAAAVTTMQAKSHFPENQPLYGWHLGSNGTSVGNELTREADVILALGVRFSDKATSSYRHGVSLSIPPTKLIQVDIDPGEIGKNYPVALGVVADVRSFLKGFLAELVLRHEVPSWQGSPYAASIATKREKWLDGLRPSKESDAEPITMGRALAELRAGLPPSAIIVTSSGNTQTQVFQEMEFVVPGTYMSSGGFSTMGWSLPAAIGAKLAKPDAPVIAVIGDGDFLMTIQELATAVQYRIPIVAVVFNSFGWQSIRDLQLGAYGETYDYATSFTQDGAPVSPDLAAAAKAFGAYSEQVRRPGELASSLKRALAQNRPAVLEVFHDTAPGMSGGDAPGWWDVPVPGYLESARAEYDAAVAEEMV
jgi:acetolactate synthase-1/2/3 large subunit